MKKKIFLAAAILMCMVASMSAQNKPQHKMSPEERMQHRAEMIAAKLFLSETEAVGFIPVYVQFQKDKQAINLKYKPAGKSREYQSDKEVEANLRAQLDKSQEILDLRKAYVDKYLAVISARQLRELYKLEQAQHRAPQNPAHGKPRK